jgi:hypothetical protein
MIYSKEVDNMCVVKLKVQTTDQLQFQKKGNGYRLKRLKTSQVTPTVWAGALHSRVHVNYHLILKKV